MEKLICGSFFFTVFEFFSNKLFAPISKLFKKGLYSHSEKGFFTRLKSEPWRAVEAQNATKRVSMPVVVDLQFFDEEQHLDPHQTER